MKIFWTRDAYERHMEMHEAQMFMRYATNRRCIRAAIAAQQGVSDADALPEVPTLERTTTRLIIAFAKEMNNVRMGLSTLPKSNEDWLIDSLAEAEAVEGLDAKKPAPVRRASK